jgi:hypothetical protein
MSLWMDGIPEIARARQQELLDSAGACRVLAATETAGMERTPPAPRRHNEPLSAPSVAARGTADERCRRIFGECGREGKDAA